MKIVEMLRLAEKGLSQREIARSAGCGKSTVGDILKLCKDKSITHDIAKWLSDDELHATLYPQRAKSTIAHTPDWHLVHEELAKNKHLNLQLLWEEYRERAPNGLSYSRFCELYRQYRKATARTVSLYHERKAGEIMEVDWMGDHLPCVADENSGDVIGAHFFVAVLGHSHMPYVEAFPNEQEMSWITGHVNALKYYGGVPRIIITDNCKTAVTKARYYEPIINSAYWELSQHYDVAVVPTRVRKPKDKAVVEQSVGWLETWLLGKLRNQRFFSFHELNKVILKLLGELSARPFQKREGSRQSEFIRIDKPALRPLPLRKYEIADVVLRRVGDNYHLEYDKFNYSVPYIHHKEQVILRATKSTIEVLDKNQVRIASHIRRYKKSEGRYVTNIDHMPDNHRAVHESRRFDGGRYRQWASSIGLDTYFVINRLLDSFSVEEQGYKSCMGILQLAKKYSNARLEAACKRAREIGSCTYTTVSTIIKKPEAFANAHVPNIRSTPKHENIRGGGYYS